MDDSWPVVDGILDRFLDVRKRLKRAGYADLPTTYDRTYFDRLKARRLVASRWSRTNAPDVHFLGEVHTDTVTNGVATANWARAIEVSNEEAYLNVARLASSRPVFVFEQSGPDDPMTVETLARQMMIDAPRAGMPPLPLAQWIDILGSGPSALLRILREFPDVAVICGEEWPLWANGALFRQLSTLPVGATANEVFDLANVFSRLRGELMVLRGIEALIRLDRRVLAIQQGYAHKRDAVAEQPVYGYALSIPDTLRGLPIY